jgi:hypothetical protein
MSTHTRSFTTQDLSVTEEAEGDEDHENVVPEIDIAGGFLSIVLVFL